MTEHAPTSGMIPPANADDVGKPPVDGAVTQLARQLMGDDWKGFPNASGG